MALKCRIRKFDAIINVLLTFKVLKSLLLQKMSLYCKKGQAEQNVAAFNVIFGIDVKGFKS